MEKEKKKKKDIPLVNIENIENIENFTVTSGRESILIICPYCGNKYKQGLDKCPKCNG